MPLPRSARLFPLFSLFRLALHFLAAAGFLLASAPARPQPPTPEGVEVVRDLEFGRGGDRPLRLHLLRPARPEPAPVIVWIHGGGWRSGSKESGIRRLAPLVRRGFAGATVEYRLSREAVFPAQIEDCKCAVRYLRARARELRLDPQRIGVWGSSAGGHLAALLGTSGGIPELEGRGGSDGVSSRVQAVCDWFGPTDFLRMNDFPSRIDHNAADSPESLLIGGPIQQHREKVGRANPISYVTADDPPFLIVHGDEDPLVPLNQSELLERALRRAGVDVALQVLRGAGHGGTGFESPEVQERIAAFFERHLRKGAP